MSTTRPQPQRSRLPPTDLDKRILALLVHEIETQNTTRVELASRLGCTTSAVGQVLSGKHAISLRTVERYLEALGKSLRVSVESVEDVESVKPLSEETK